MSNNDIFYFGMEGDTTMERPIYEYPLTPTFVDDPTTMSHLLMLRSRYIMGLDEEETRNLNSEFDAILEEDSRADGDESLIFDIEF